MKTIKEMRQADALRLAQRVSEEPTTEEVEAATKAMRAFYRFCGAYLAEFYVDQNRASTEAQRKEATDKMERAYKRATDLLKPYGCVIDIPGLNPIIDDINGRNFTMGHFYS